MARLTRSAGPDTGGGRPAPARELTVTSADGSRLHAEVHGDATAPPVVLAHGWTCATRFWDPVIRRLTAAGLRVVVYDQRGHGRSPQAEVRAYSPAALADDLCAVLRTTLERGEKAVVGGHSMGGMTVMAAAGRSELTEHGAALMLCSTGAHRLAEDSAVLPLPSPRLRRLAHRAVLRAGLPLGPVNPVTKKVLKYVTLSPGASPEAVDAAARLVHACPPKARAAWGGVLGQLDLAAHLPRLTAPTAVVAGDADRLTPVVHAQGLAAALPDCAGLTELTGAGHMTPLEAPDAVADVLLRLARAHLDDGAGVPSPRTSTRPTAARQEETP